MRTGSGRNASASGILASLDDDQRAAAATIDGPLLIVAGPGSGKTRTLTHRMAHLIAEHGVTASGCLALTFTRRAAAEMRDRLETLLPAVAGEIPIHTFHSLGLAVLKEHAGAAGLDRDFLVASEAERAAVLGERLSLSDRKAWSLLRAISKSKRTQQAANAEAQAAMPIYQDALASRHWVDFDDLVGLMGQLFTADPAIAAHYRDRFRYISADEFQDVDEQQYRLLKLLAPSATNLCLIGDPNQAIYGFRGADASCFDRFTRDYPNTTTIQLTRNYRSSGTIVTASSRVIAPAELLPPAGDAERDLLDRIAIHAAATEPAEAEFVVHTIEQMIGGHTFFSIDSGRTTEAPAMDLSFADFAVLYRTDAQSAALCEAFGRSGMPFQKHGHDPLVERPGVQALLRELEQANNRESEPTALTAALRAAADHLLLHNAGLETSAIHDALQQLVLLAATVGNDRVRFTEAVAVASEVDTRDPRADRVSLLTVHAAKGLEFPVVFIVGLEAGVLPLYWGNKVPDAAAMAEERRLFYVGMTRAKDRLILTRAMQRHWQGRSQMLDPSPFLSDIEEALVRHERMAAGPQRSRDKQLTLL